LCEYPLRRLSGCGRPRLGLPFPRWPAFVRFRHPTGGAVSRCPLTGDSRPGWRCALLQSLLDGCGAVAQHAGHELARGPEYDDDNDGEVQTERQKMRLMHAQTRFTRQPADRGGVLEIRVFFLVFPLSLARLVG